MPTDLLYYHGNSYLTFCHGDKRDKLIRGWIRILNKYKINIPLEIIALIKIFDKLDSVFIAINYSLWSIELNEDVSAISFETSNAMIKLGLGAISFAKHQHKINKSMI